MSHPLPSVPTSAGERLRRWGHSTNLVGVPTELLASADFNEEPLPLHIAGVREMFGGLFEMLGQAESAAEAGEAFHAYTQAVFGLEAEQQESDRGGRRRFRSSYLQLLKGWGFDANRREGAVLKGWVESRFGLYPVFHREKLHRFGSPAWMTYIEEKMSSRFHNNSIQTQLDLLYEFCQWSLARFFLREERHITLYRGVDCLDEHLLIERLGRRRALVRLNSLTSFTAERDIAESFGDHILEVRVPAVKILFFPRLLPHHALKGEAEYIVIGGDYRVTYSFQ
jgi:NAD+---dinitrogen-reductase ADP-D-ribosyltransferase